MKEEFLISKTLTNILAREGRNTNNSNKYKTNQHPELLSSARSSFSYHYVDQIVGVKSDIK